MILPQAIARAHARLKPHIIHTPLLESSQLNAWLGHRVLFKAEGFQKMGAFKFRGAMNALLTLREEGRLPQKIVTYSSGNHAQAVALAAKLLGVHATVVMAETASSIKIQATRGYGAHVILTPTRQEAETLAKKYQGEGYELIPPYDHDAIIAGQGTVCFEALQDAGGADAVFAPCGGGGLLSGTYLGAQLVAPTTPVYGAEPLNANDAAQSLRSGRIVRFTETPQTIADGVATLSVSERSFAYLQKLAGIYEVTEEHILYWTQWLTHLLKVAVEPTSAAAMAAATQWLASQTERKTALVILSGANIAPETQMKIWRQNLLERLPALESA